MIVNLGGASKVTLKSSPPGLIPSRITFPERNSTFTSTSLNGLSNGYYFSHWEINGVRQADTKGIALGKVTEVLNEDKKIIRTRHGDFKYAWGFDDEGNRMIVLVDANL